MRLRPDDEVYRVRAVWLGPQGFTLPWLARYLAYGIWLVVFLAILLFEALTPLEVGLPPVWEVVISVLVAYAAMSFVDHDRPLGSVVATVLHETTAPRPAPRVKRVRVQTDRVRLREHHASARSQDDRPAG